MLLRWYGPEGLFYRDFTLYKTTDLHIRLNLAARADITWWYLFAEKWNGLSIAWDLKRCNPDIIVHSDASDSWGGGAYSACYWFQLEWSLQAKELSIAIKELFPVVISAALFGKRWSGSLIDFRVDNMAVVQVIQATYCKDSHLMHLIRLLVFFAAYFNFWFSASHSFIGSQESPYQR